MSYDILKYHRFSVADVSTLLKKFENVRTDLSPNGCYIALHSDGSMGLRDLKTDKPIILCDDDNDDFTSFINLLISKTNNSTTISFVTFKKKFNINEKTDPLKCVYDKKFICKSNHNIYKFHEKDVKYYGCQGFSNRCEDSVLF